MRTILIYVNAVLCVIRVGEVIYSRRNEKNIKKLAIEYIEEK
jgi:hypothetical protein